MNVLVLLSGITALAAGNAAAQGAPGPAAVAAGQWVTSVDDAHYDRSWAEAGALFKNRITQDEWARQIAKARGPLGQVVSRAFRSENKTKALPGEPDGDYDVVTFATELTHKKVAVETVVVAREDAGWKVDGYFIR